MTTLDRQNAPRAARRLVAAGCARAATGRECADSAGLLASEVVTNALLHGDGDVTIGMDAGAAMVRVEVGDASRSRPREDVPGEEAERGRGLLIVNALSSAWGVTDALPGKIVWFEVPVQP